MTVYLVGAGPGDSELITVRGLALLRQADVVVFDRLVAAELVDAAPPDALRIARESLSQEQVNELLVAYGRAGLAVVRLKGGDPFVFGRGGEETQALSEAAVDFEVVPGVSVLSAGPAAAGIPLTQRGTSSQLVAVAAPSAELDFGQLARIKGTLVFFMGLANLEAIAAGLIGHGMSAETPAAVISRATTPEQEAVVSMLGNMADAAAGLQPPALIVVGETVALARQEHLEALLASPA